MEVSTSATGPLPVDEAWERYADPTRWPTWAPHLRRVDLDPGPSRLRAGLHGTVRGALGLAADFQVTAVDESDRSWSWTVRPVLAVALPFRIDLHHTLEATDAGTVAGLRLLGPAPVVLTYRPLAQWALQRLVRSRGRLAAA